MTKVLKTSGYNWYENNKARSAELGRRWRARYPARAEALSRYRRERLVQATPKWLTREDWDRMDALYVEARRLTIETGIEHEVDHIYPIAGRTSCGLHVPWNMQVITGIRNRKKSNLHPEEAA